MLRTVHRSTVRRSYESAAAIRWLATGGSKRRNVKGFGTGGGGDSSSAGTARHHPKSHVRRRNAAKVRLDARSNTYTSDNGSILSTDLPYGMQRIDYNVTVPRSWPLPPHPPPRTNKFRRYFPAFLAATTVIVGVYIYINRDPQVYEYWKQVEQGHVPLEYGEDDDSDITDFDEDADEWEEAENGKAPPRK